MSARFRKLDATAHLNFLESSFPRDLIPLLFAFLRERGLKSTTDPGTWILSVSGEGANPGVKDLRRLAVDVGLDARESEPVIDRVVEACRQLKDVFLRNSI